MGCKICREGFRQILGAGIVIAAFGCNNPNEAETREPTTMRASALTEAPTPAIPPSGANVLRESDIGPAPGLARLPFQGIPRPSDVPASQHPGHFRNKLVAKPAPDPMGTPAPPAQAAYIAKQKEYAKQLGSLEPTIVNLPPDEQEARRAELKRSVLGE